MIRILLSIAVLFPATRTLAADIAAQPRLDVPAKAEQCTANFRRQVDDLAVRFEQWAADVTRNADHEDPHDIVRRLAAVISAKNLVDQRLESLLALRTQFVPWDAGPDRLAVVQQYLRITSRMIDLSGRIRYLLRDAIDEATYDLGPHPQQLDQMIDLLIEQRVAIGAAVMTYALFDPPGDSGLESFSLAERRKVLRLIQITREHALLPDLAAFLEQKDVAGELVVLAAEAVREIGLPQAPRPAAGPEETRPAIRAEFLRARLAAVDAAALTPELQQRRVDLLNWLARRIKLGVEGDRFRLGHFEVRAGDWLLMRNPSPYNTFTDLSPGLFTHVGVVAVETGSDGIRRFVITDLPERGDRVPATNVETYLVRTLHYFFLRHEDPQVGEKMGQVAATLIGNETQFDLTFRTDRVLKLKGMPLENQRLNTYCAGFLLICAQETTALRSDFFPIPEHPPGQRFLTNLAKLDISIGDNFVSPTGAVFSPHLKLVGRRRPMYSPDREIKEAIYDHFGYLMINEPLTPTQNTYQSLRTKVASLSQSNPLLARALAKASNVSEHMDLQAAAKTAAVVETLDEIADDNMYQFLAARRALLAGPLDELQAQGSSDEEVARTKELRRRHGDLFENLLQGKVTLREMRIELVDYYVRRGKQQLRERFFQGQQ